MFLADGSTGARLAEVKTFATSYTGIAFRPGDRELWASETSRNGPDSIAIIPIDDLGRPGKIDRIELAEGHPAAGRHRVLRRRSDRLRRLQPQQLAGRDRRRAARVTREIPVGMAPFGVAVAAKIGTDLRHQPRRAAAGGGRHGRAVQRLGGRHRPGDRLVHHRHAHA